MMKYNYDIDYIRGLLDKYYRAETSPQDEEIIENFFNDVNAHEIPEDLTSEKKMFSLLSNLHPSQEESVAPDFLMERLNSIVEKPMESSRLKKKFRKKLLYLGGSVAACIIVAFFMVFMLLHKVDTSGEKVVAESQKKPETHIIVKTEDPTMDEPVVEHNDNISEVEASSENLEDVVEEDGFIEITDPEEAREILQKIGNLLAQNTEDTNDAIANISSSIESYKEISKSILQ